MLRTQNDIKIKCIGPQNSLGSLVFWYALTDMQLGHGTTSTTTTHALASISTGNSTGAVLLRINGDGMAVQIALRHADHCASTRLLRQTHRAEHLALASIA